MTDDKPIVIECDICSQGFGPEDIIMKKQKFTGVSVEYWNCPYCKHPYVVKFTDKKQKALDSQISGYAAMIRLRKAHGKSIPAARLKKLDSLMEFSKGYQQVLKEKFSEIVTAELKELDIESGEETNSINGKE